MTLALPLCMLLSAAAPPSTAMAPRSILVRFESGVVDIQAEGAPVYQVVDEVARQTGMRVVYDGERPSARVTARIEKLPPSQALTALLEGLGLNYMMAFDRTHTLVSTLVFVALEKGSSPGQQITRVGATRPAPFGSPGAHLDPTQPVTAPDEEVSEETVVADTPPVVPARAAAGESSAASAVSAVPTGGAWVAGVAPSGVAAPSGSVRAGSALPSTSSSDASEEPTPPVDASTDGWTQRNGTFPGAVPRPPTKPDPQD